MDLVLCAASPSGLSNQSPPRAQRRSSPLDTRLVESILIDTAPELYVRVTAISSKPNAQLDGELEAAWVQPRAR
jgi:hypothetical protein